MNSENQEFLRLVGIRFNTWRELKELSMVEIQYRTGIARSTISGIERGKSAPNLVTLKPICELYGLSIDYLMGIE